MSFGRNRNRELIVGDDINKNIPTLIPNSNEFKDFSAGYHFFIALLS